MKNTEQPPCYYVEKLRDNNLADASKLYSAVYRTALPSDFFSKKYDTAFTGVKYVGFIAYNKQAMPIALYAVIPCFIKLNNKIILGAQSADTMTHPGYRNKGLFVELALLTFQLCRSVGIHLLFGFPNQNSLPGFINKLGWQMTERMNCFIIRSSLFPWRSFLSKFPFIKKHIGAFRKKVLKKYLLNQQGIANSAVNNGFAGVYRDKRYLGYKTYSDTHVFKTGNSILWIKIQNELLIGDILVTPNEFCGVMRSLKKLASKLGLKEIHFHTSPGTNLCNLFARDYKPIPSFPVIFKDLGVGAQLENIKFTSADIDTF